GQQLIALVGESVRLWDLTRASPESQELLPSSRGYVFSAAASLLAEYPNTRGIVRVWKLDANKLREVGELEGCESLVMAFSSDGNTLATRMKDGAEITLWDLSVRPPRAAQTLKWTSGTLKEMQF